MFEFVASECRYPLNNWPSGRKRRVGQWRHPCFPFEWHAPKVSLLQNFVKEATYSLVKVDNELSESKTNRKSFIPNFHQESNIFLFDCLHYFVGLNYELFNYTIESLSEKMSIYLEICPVRRRASSYARTYNWFDKGPYRRRRRRWWFLRCVTLIFIVCNRFIDQIILYWLLEELSCQFLRSKILSLPQNDTCKWEFYLGINEDDRKVKRTGRRQTLGQARFWTYGPSSIS